MSEENDLSSSLSRYAEVHERGLLLPDSEIDVILSNAFEGIRLAKDCLGLADDPFNHICFGNNPDCIGYVHAKNPFINIPIPWLNGLHAMGRPIERCILDYYPWLENLFVGEFLTAACAEETIHYFQYKGSPQLQTHPTLEDMQKYSLLPKILQACCSVEVEARVVTDRALQRAGRRLLWQLFDTQLQAQHPELYNQPIDKIYISWRLAIEKEVM